MILSFFCAVRVFQDNQPSLTIYTLNSPTLFKDLKDAFIGMRDDGFHADIMFSNIFTVGMLFLCLIFLMPLIILFCVQSKNLLTNETTSERFGKRRPTLIDSD